MKVTLLGTGSAWPDADRSSPAFLLEHDNIPYLIDCGGGVSHQLMKVNIPPSKLKTIFLTHIHIDHCVDFPSLIFGAYLTGKEGSFNLFGPLGIKKFVDGIFNHAYDFAKPMLKSLRNKDIIIDIKEQMEGVVFKENSLTVSTLPVEHGGFPTIGYKFEANGKSIVFSADTEPCDNIVTLSKDADLLILDCSFPESFGLKKGHCIPSQAGKVATDAKVKKLCLVHLFPVCKGKEEEILEEVRKHYNGEVFIGNDLDIVEI